MESSVEFFIDLGIVIGSLLTTNLDSSSKAVQFFSWWRFKLSLLKNASPQSHFIFSSLCTLACLERLLCRVNVKLQTLQTKSIIKFHSSGTFILILSYACFAHISSCILKLSSYIIMLSSYIRILSSC